MNGNRMALLGGACLLLGACAGPVVLGINVGTVATVGSVASTATTGKGLGEHAVSAVLEKDCRLIETLVRKDREFCEEYGSPAQKEDFTGIASWFEPQEPAPPTMLATTAPQGGSDITAETPATVSASQRAVETMPLEPTAVAVLESPPAPPVASAPVVRTAAAPPAPRPKPAAERAVADGRFAVQVGTFAEAGNAEAFARKLRAGGYKARVTQVRGDGRKTLSVIHITGFRDAAAAERAAAAVARDHDTGPALVLTRA
jgi:cell division septation protein DedD